MDVMLVEMGEREERHLKIQVELNLTEPLMRGMKLKYRSTEYWIEFKYEQLSLFCFYYGIIGHNEKLCESRKKDIQLNKVSGDQFGHCMRDGSRRGVRRGPGVGKENQEQAGKLVKNIKNFVVRKEEGPKKGTRLLGQEKRARRGQLEISRRMGKRLWN